MGIVEGLTEFIPVSSTGHLILADAFLKFSQHLGSKEKADIFVVCIQLGAIMAIGWIYRKKLIGAFLSPLSMLKSDAAKNRDFNAMMADDDFALLFKLGVATVPAAAVGFFFDDIIEAVLFFPVPVAIALIVGGIAILIVEALAPEPRATSTAQMTWQQALVVGLAQILALIPGTSRSGATIMGGLGAGMDRRTATEFSFLLSFPIMVLATAYKLVKNYELVDFDYIAILILGLFVAFVSAYAVVRWLISYVQTHTFAIFAYYRIVIGIIILILVYNGLMGTGEVPSSEPMP